jgi:hypothetical protein
MEHATEAAGTAPATRSGRIWLLVAIFVTPVLMAGGIVALTAWIALVAFAAADWLPLTTPVAAAAVIGAAAGAAYLVPWPAFLRRDWRQDWRAYVLTGRTPRFAGKAAVHVVWWLWDGLVRIAAVVFALRFDLRTPSARTVTAAVATSLAVVGVDFLLDWWGRLRRRASTPPAAPAGEPVDGGPAPDG